LVRCLHALAAQQLDRGWFEIIVVDNGSRMPLAAIAQGWPGVTFLRETEPGPGPARNLGVRHSQGAVLAFIDADIRAAPDWLQQAVDAVEADPSRPVGGDVRIDMKDPRSPSGVEAFEAVFAFRQKMYIERQKFSGSGNLACTRALFDRVGGFGPIATAEDKTWGQKASAMGHPPRYVPAMIVYHPARSGHQETRARWQRIMEHQYLADAAAGKPRWRWTLYSFAVLLATVAQTPQFLLSPRVNGVSGRVKGLAFLFQTRWNRFIDMRRIARRDGEISALQWNR
jgi:glycosyltransferase involved in cell wall biosynthesis